MTEERLPSKFTFILHADITGSTALVQQDEELAHKRIQDTFRRFSDIISKYHGHVRELRGDALLAEFERASDAVSAALTFQAEQAEHIKQLKDTILPVVRAGIAMGEVIVADNTVTGAGVVLAQRIEQLAEPGGLCITGAIHEALPQRMPFDQANLGERRVKGFDEPIRVYTVGLKKGASLPKPSIPSETKGMLALHWKRVVATAIFLCAVVILALLQPWKLDSQPASVEKIGLPPQERPSIAVLPFTNRSDDPEQQYFSDGISEDIITDLSQLSNLEVIARNSSFSFRDSSANIQEIGKDLGARFLLEGSVRKSGNQIRITAQLIDTESGRQLWAERFDRELSDVFTLQDEITQKIVSALSIHITGDQKRQLVHDATSSFEAYDLFLRGQAFRVDYSAEGLEMAMNMFRRSIGIDPGFARAYGALAVAMMRYVFAGYSIAPAEAENRAMDLALEAARLDPDSPQVQWALGYVHMYRNQFDEAVKALERAIVLSPNYADAYALLALLRNNQGQGEEAKRLIEQGMALNPHYSWDYIYNLGRAHYLLGQYQQAVEYLEQALTRNASPSYPRLFLIASLVQLDRVDDAEWEVEQLGMFHEEVTLTHIRQTLPLSNEELMNGLLNDLRTAGMRE